MYILSLHYYKSSESKYPDEVFEFHYLKGRTRDFAELYNLHEDLSCGELDFRRDTNIEEVKKWLKDGIITLSFPSNDSNRFNEIVLSAPSPILEISVYYWQSGYDIYISPEDC